MIRFFCIALTLLLPASALAGEEPDGRNWGLADTGPGGAATAPILLLDGSAAAPSLSFIDDTDCGLHRTTGNLRLNCGGGVNELSIASGVSNFGAPINLLSNSLQNPDDIYQSADMAYDAAATPVTVIGTKHPYPGIGATNNDGADLCIVPASGGNDLTGVTAANTAGDTLTFATIDYDCATTATVLTEGVDFACVAETDADCVVNIVAAVEALSSALGLNAVTAVGETTNFYPAVGTVAHLTVVSSDNTNIVISRGDGGALVVGGDIDTSGNHVYDSSRALCLGGAVACTVVNMADTTGFVLSAGQHEFLNATHFKATLNIYATQSFGTGAAFGSMVQGADDGLRLNMGSNGSGNGHLILTRNTNVSKDHDHEAFDDNPVLFIHSGTDPDSDNTQWVSIAHDRTNGVIATGAGAIDLDPASGGVRIGRLIAASVSEPSTCNASAEGTMVYVNDSDDSGGARVCICATITDDSTYDWRDLGDIVGTACPFF